MVASWEVRSHDANLKYLMNENSTYQAVRIGDIADWRLICVISSKGMCAYLKHVNPTEDVITLIDKNWPENPDTLLENIESTVYDHPQVLDDFTTDMAVIAPKSVWIPSEICEDDEDLIAELYNKVYLAEPEDVMSDICEEQTCAYTLTPGLKAFLQRTFPGARVHSHLGVMVSRFRDRSADMPRVYIDIRQGECDFVVFDRRNLLLASTHQWHEQNDIKYHLYNILNVYDLKPKEVQVSLSGLRDIKTSLMVDLRETLSYVMLTTMPSVSSKTGMPLHAAMLMRK